jgi:hypothetical protein
MNTQTLADLIGRFDPETFDTVELYMQADDYARLASQTELDVLREEYDFRAAERYALAFADLRNY